MKIKNIIGVIFFALLGMAMTLIVFYPYALEYLGKGPEKHFGWKEIGLLSIAFVFFWGSAKFITLADYIIEGFKSRFNFKNK